VAESTRAQLQRSAAIVGAGSGAIGAALLIAPTQLGRPVLGLTRPAEVRAVGILDLALAAGLMTVTTRWPWAASRAVANLAIAAWCLHRGRPPAVRREGARAAAALTAITVIDARLAGRLRRVETTRT